MNSSTHHSCQSPKDSHISMVTPRGQVQAFPFLTFLTCLSSLRLGLWRGCLSVHPTLLARGNDFRNAQGTGLVRVSASRPLVRRAALACTRVAAHAFVGYYVYSYLLLSLTPSYHTRRRNDQRLAFLALCSRFTAVRASYGHFQRTHEPYLAGILGTRHCYLPLPEYSSILGLRFEDL